MHPAFDVARIFLMTQPAQKYAVLNEQQLAVVLQDYYRRYVGNTRVCRNELNELVVLVAFADKPPETEQRVS